MLKISEVVKGNKEHQVHNAITGFIWHGLNINSSLKSSIYRSFRVLPGCEYDITSEEIEEYLTGYYNLCFSSYKVFRKMVKNVNFTYMIKTDKEYLICHQLVAFKSVRALYLYVSKHYTPGVVPCNR